MTSPDDPPESLASLSTRGRRTHRTRAKRGAPRFLGRPPRVAETLSVTPPPVAVGPEEPAEPSGAPPEERRFDEADEQFFLSEDSLAPTALAVSDLAEATDAEAEHAPLSKLQSPRRRALARYVGVLVLIAAVFCVAAFSARSTKPATTAAPVRPATLVPMPAPANLVAPPEAPPVAFDAERAPSVIDPAAAIEARERARSALSKGDVRTAVTAGTQSVELDPSDAEAWLVLGAAEMALGERAKSLSTFRACTAVATRGPRHECGQMLQ